MSFLFLFLIAGSLSLLLASSWGPGTHLEFAHRVYRSRRRTLPANTADLLRREQSAYFYGNLAADIINFKGFGGHRNHCHRWTIVEDMRAVAATDAEHAFALGYLSHLAADTIAHNHFVPYHLARYARSKSLGHLYWEMMADRYVSTTRWTIVTKLKADPSLDALDDLVNRMVPRKALSMRANKLLFNHVLLCNERDRWRNSVKRLHGMSTAPLELDFLERFRRAAVGRVRLALGPDGIQDLQHLDTTGKAAQKSAWRARRRALRSHASPKKLRAKCEEQAAPYLEGMQSPPPEGGEPHWPA